MRAVLYIRDLTQPAPAMPSLPLSERFLMLLLITTNLLNYIDRGIVPGASGAFDSFIEGSETTWGTSAAFGALTSAKTNAPLLHNPRFVEAPARLHRRN